MNAQAALAQLAEDKRALESRIRDLIGAEVAAFTKDTGVGVKGVEVRAVSFQYIGAPTDYRVSGVTVALDLG